MTTDRNAEYLAGLVRELCKLPRETEWVEFKQDRIRACYLHACLRHVTRQPMTNTSIRERFGIEEKNAALASRLLNEAVDDGKIVVRDLTVGTKSRTYLPYWAGPNSLEPGLLP